MEQAHRTPSGNWKIKVYAYKDSEGKQHCKTFTADTKKEAERLARQYKYGVADKASADITVSEAVSQYIALKESTLSPSTIRSYAAMLKSRIDGTVFGNLSVSRVTSVAIQKYVGTLVGAGISSKTVRNVYGLVSSAIRTYRPDIAFHATLPAKVRPALYAPTDAEVRTLLESIKSDRQLTIAVLLAAFGTMRRSEICGLSYSDIHGNSIHVQTTRVQDKNKEWIYKPYPKNDSSVRDVEMPPEVIKTIGRGFGYIIQDTPTAITDRFRRAVVRAGLPHFRFHDLRAYSASILLTLIPQKYVMARGGWKTPAVMERHYDRVLTDVDREMQQRATEHFSSVVNGSN